MKIGLCGTMSVGKTTLVNALQKLPQFKDYNFATERSEFIREYDYIFYISPYGLKIEDNGVRETDEHYRDLIDFTITTLIKRYGHRCNVVEKISGSTEERIQQILNITGL